VTVSSRLRLAASFRSDTDIEETVDSVPVADVDLPVTLTGGILLAPHPALRWSATVSWRSWSDASASVGQNGGNTAFDTWEVGSGLEFGGSDAGASRFPLRVGVRYAQLPFSPTDDRPEEWVVAAGSAIQFASNRALLEATLERIFRNGGGARERVWQISVGLRLVP
jgi:long-subunit fatty acid transport protein